MCLATRRESQGKEKKAAEKKQPKEVVIKCKAEDFQGSFRFGKSQASGQFCASAQTLFFISFLY